MRDKSSPVFVYGLSEGVVWSCFTLCLSFEVGPWSFDFSIPLLSPHPPFFRLIPDQSETTNWSRTHLH